MTDHVICRICQTLPIIQSSHGTCLLASACADFRCSDYSVVTRKSKPDREMQPKGLFFVERRSVCALRARDGSCGKGLATSRSIWLSITRHRRFVRRSQKWQSATVVGLERLRPFDKTPESREPCVLATGAPSDEVAIKTFGKPATGCQFWAQRRLPTFLFFREYGCTGDGGDS